MKRLLITDLDNTLYDWVTFYARSFACMVDELVLALAVPRDRILDEFKAIHQRYGNSEQPFAALELPSVRERFGKLGRDELARRLARPFEAFSNSRRASLHLYEGVAETLAALHARGVKIVGHTEAIAVNAWYRLRLLGVAPLITRLYALEGHLLPHPFPDRQSEHRLPDELVRVVPRAERKPNPQLLLDICAREQINPSDACYVGDSLTRDISMAKSAGVCAVWARYGTEYDPSLWSTLVRVTHWTPEDVAREADLKRHLAGLQPDYTIAAFGELLDIVADANGRAGSQPRE